MLTQQIRYRGSIYYVALWLGLSLLFCMQSCKKENEVDPGFGPNGEPRVLALHVPNIPDQNIRIDQELKRIEITIPTNFSPLSVQPAYQLTPSTTIITGGSDYLFPLSGSSGVTVTLSTEAKVTNTYHYSFKPAGDLYFAKSSTPILYTVTKDGGYRDACFLVYNYIDSVGSGKLILTHKETGKQLTFEQAGDRYCATSRQTDGAVVVKATFDPRTYYQPGSYSVELVKPSGRRATLEQPFQLQRGIPTLYLGDNYNRPFQLGGPSYSLPGANILQDDKLTLRLRGRNQNPVTVQPTGFLASQPGIQLPALTGLTPGYYYAQLVLNGVEQPSYVRLMLVANANDLVITDFRSVDQTGLNAILDPGVSLDSPITLTYGGLYQVQTNRNLYPFPTDNRVPRIRLSSQTDPSKDYYLSLDLNPADINSLKYGSFTVPTTVPSGRYQLTYQLVSPDQSVISTIPLERDVAIQ